VPKFPFIAVGWVAAVGRQDFSGDAFLVSIVVHIPKVACRFPAVGIFLNNHGSLGT
jgi:hypothetical protein